MTGETLTSTADGDAATIALDVLREAVRHTYIAALCARRWPSGGRHDTYLALAGFLLSAGVPADVAKKIALAIAYITNPTDGADRRKAVDDGPRAVENTEVRLKAGDKGVAGPTLAEHLGDNVVALLVSRST